ncbi:hypothetical protein PRABACTJOHN_03635 [Parabacteroides johnsonii DSM 18315]|uniref:Uncharacterized protein n=1 Tax=Parabacteroides johnsonii DSM 18315 TaxID=537006 RepID=B7BF06_9BACT|nr:hypothetical protein PRABACTJOHN_03635 [Parabacteroides johnsonii DSM 18315]
MFFSSLRSEAIRLLPSGFDFYVHSEIAFKENQTRNLGGIL